MKFELKIDLSFLNFLLIACIKITTCYIQTLFVTKKWDGSNHLTRFSTKLKFQWYSTYSFFVCLFLNKLSYEEYSLALQRARLDISDRLKQELFQAFDIYHTNHIDYSILIHSLESWLNDPCSVAIAIEKDHYQDKVMCRKILEIIRHICVSKSCLYEIN